MKKKDTKSKIDNEQKQSVDGILINNRSYQPGKTGKRPTLGDITDKLDGFYPQRVSAEIGDLEGYNPIIMDDSLKDEPKEDKITDPTKPDLPKRPKKRFKRLMFWRKDKGEKKRLTRKQKIVRWVIKILILLVLLVGGYFGYKFWQTSHDVFHGGGQSAGLAECRDISQLKKEGDCRINILLLGIGGPGHDGPNLTDTILLASIDPINNSVALLSIPRDLWVQIPGYGSQKINSAYPDGLAGSTAKSDTQKKRDGLALLDKTLEPIIGMNINYHILVDFSAFKQAVNDVGGVTINVPETLYDPTIAWENHNNPIIAQKGVQTMNGAQALLYARSRETSSDFARGQRQRALLVAIGNKVLSLGTFSNPVRVSNLLDSFGQNVYTDFSVSNLKPLYGLASRIPAYDITSLDLATSPGNLVTTGAINGLSVVYPVAGLSNYSQITPYVRATLRDGYLAKENAQVAVYNGTTTAGLAGQVAAVLQSYGYRVTDVATDTSSTPITKTTIVDLSGGKDPYTRYYLELRFGASAVTSLPAGRTIKPKQGADFVIILGTDASTSSTSTTTTN